MHRRAGHSLRGMPRVDIQVLGSDRGGPC
jgi:hypothetical protein